MRIYISTNWQEELKGSILNPSNLLEGTESVPLQQDQILDVMISSNLLSKLNVSGTKGTSHDPPISTSRVDVKPPGQVKPSGSKPRIQLNRAAQQLPSLQQQLLLQLGIRLLQLQVVGRLEA